MMVFEMAPEMKGCTAAISLTWAMGAMNRVPERPLNHLDETLILQLMIRDVDRDSDLRETHVVPGPNLGARRSHHPFAQGSDQAGFLGDWNEFDWADDAVLGRVPANQSLH